MRRGRAEPTEAALHEVVTAFRAGISDADPSCALCRLSTRSADRALGVLFSEFVNDPPTREAVRRGRGFCPGHARRVAEVGDALGASILLSDLARLTRERWSEPPSALSRLARRPEPSASCPACAAYREAEARYAAALASGLNSEAVWDAYSSGPFLCVPHVEALLTFTSSSISTRVRALECQRLEALQAELDEFIRKNDYRFRGEPWGAERDAWLRALSRLHRPSH